MTAITSIRTTGSGVAVTADLTGTAPVPHGSGTLTPASAVVFFTRAGDFTGADITGELNRGPAGRDIRSVAVLPDLDGAPAFVHDLVALACSVLETTR